MKKHLYFINKSVYIVAETYGAAEFMWYKHYILNIWEIVQIDVQGIPLFLE